MTRGSNPPPPAQWNLQGWMAAYHAAQCSPNTTPPPVQSKKEPKKEEEQMPDKMMGGWEFEGIDKPVPPVICTKCQGGGTRLKDQIPDIRSWCQDCKDGKPGPGHEPEGIRPLSVSQIQDAATLNKSFFGGL